MGSLFCFRKNSTLVLICFKMKIYDYTDENITQAILDSLTRIPPISPEAAVHRLVVQECPISPSTITDYQDDSLEDEQMVTTHHDLPNVSTPDTRYTVTHGINASIFLHYTLALLQITLYLLSESNVRNWRIMRESQMIRL